MRYINLRFTYLLTYVLMYEFYHKPTNFYRMMHMHSAAYAMAQCLCLSFSLSHVITISVHLYLSPRNECRILTLVF